MGMIHFYQIKDSKNNTQYIKQLKISAHHVPKHNQMAVLYRKYRQVGLKKAHMMTLCFLWTELLRRWEAQRKERLGMSNVLK